MFDVQPEVPVAAATRLPGRFEDDGLDLLSNRVDEMPNPFRSCGHWHVGDVVRRKRVHNRIDDGGWRANVSRFGAALRAQRVELCRNRTNGADDGWHVVRAGHRVILERSGHQLS